MSTDDFRDPEVDGLRREFAQLVAVGYDLDRGVLRFSERGLTRHDMRAILVGLWLRLPRADRVDHIAELQHYLQPKSRPPGIARLIAQAGNEFEDVRGRG